MARMGQSAGRRSTSRTAPGGPSARGGSRTTSHKRSATVPVTAARPRSAGRQPAASTSARSGAALSTLPKDPTPTEAPASVAKTAGG